MASDRPTTGIFIAWDAEELTPERRDAGGLHDRTVIVARHTVTRQVLWTSSVTDAHIANAERYADSIRDQYDNVRVQVFTGEPGSTR